MYLVFMIIATLAYLTIPTIASYIISSSGVGSALQRMTNMSTAMVMGSMPAAGFVGQAGLTAGGAIAGAVGGLAVAGGGALMNGAQAVGQTAANYGSYYGQAVKHEAEKLRTITKG